MLQVSMGRPHTRVHNHLETGAARFFGSRLVNDTHLRQDHLGADGNSASCAGAPHSGKHRDGVRLYVYHSRNLLIAGSR